MSNTVKEGRRSLEERSKTLEEKARLEKLAIDKKLAAEILEEENRTHNVTIKELENTIEEENRTHNTAVKELEDKIAHLEEQMKPPSSPETPSSQTVPEPTKDVSDEADESTSVGMLQEPEQNKVQVPPEEPKKKRRGFL